MRTLSPSAIKGSDRKTETPTLPSPGSKIRNIYDALYQSRGRPMTSSELEAFMALTNRDRPQERSRHWFSNAVKDLNNYWGCDIRIIGKLRASGPNRGRSLSEYCLVGEWCGRAYIDYTQAATEEAAL